MPSARTEPSVPDFRLPSRSRRELRLSITQRVVVIPYRRPETSVRNYHYSLRNRQEERSFQNPQYKQKLRTVYANNKHKLFMYCEDDK